MPAIWNAHEAIPSPRAPRPRSRPENAARAWESASTAIGPGAARKPDGDPLEPGGRDGQEHDGRGHRRQRCEHPHRRRGRRDRAGGGDEHERPCQHDLLCGQRARQGSGRDGHAALPRPPAEDRELRDLAEPGGDDRVHQEADEDGGSQVAMPDPGPVGTHGQRPAPHADLGRDRRQVRQDGEGDQAHGGAVERAPCGSADPGGADRREACDDRDGGDGGGAADARRGHEQEGGGGHTRAGDGVEEEVVGGHDDREDDQRRVADPCEPEAVARHGETGRADRDRVRGVQRRHGGVGVREHGDQAGVVIDARLVQRVDETQVGQHPGRCRRIEDVSGQADQVDGGDQIPKPRIELVAAQVDEEHEPERQRELAVEVRPVRDAHHDRRGVKCPLLQVELVEEAQAPLGVHDRVRVSNRGRPVAHREGAGQLVGHVQQREDRELTAEVAPPSREARSDGGDE